MRYVSLANFCKMTGLTAAEVEDYEERGLIRSTIKNADRFYSLREAYRAKGIIYFMRTQGLSPEEAATKVDEQTQTGNGVSV